MLYQPQTESLKDIELKARMAVSVTKKGSETPAFGAVWFTATLDIDRDDRMVEIEKIRVDRVKVPQSTPEQEKLLAEFLEDEFPDLDLEISLDRLLAAIDQTQFHMKSTEALKNDPPKIIVMMQPASQGASSLNRDHQSRQRGAQRTQSYQGDAPRGGGGGGRRRWGRSARPPCCSRENNEARR